jgi:glycosyltransferase involved in cell wall biosynthesis
VIEGDWPPAPAGRDVVLHTRVVTGAGGGPDKTILLAPSVLADSRYWLAAAYMHPPQDPGFESLRRRALAAGCPLLSIPDRGPLDRGVLRRLRELCAHYQVRIWHAHDYKSNLLGVMLRPFWGMKLVTTVHGWVKHTTRTPLYYAVDRWCLPRYHHVISVSEDLHQRVRSLGVPEDRCTLLPNGVDDLTFVRKFPAAQSPLRVELGVPPGRLVVGAMGRLSAEKGFNSLIRATHQLVGEGLDIELWIAGEGEAQHDLEKLAVKLGLADRVRLLGFHDDPVEVYHGMDLFVLSSLREGLPNVVLEAMAMEVPVVSTRVAGVPDLIHDGRDGVLCPIGDREALAAAMGRVLRDAGLRGTLAAAARRTIHEKCSFRKRMLREKDIYDRVMGVGGGTMRPRS